MSDVPTYAQLEKIGKRAKEPSRMRYRPPKSRKRSYMARRAAVRDSKRVYRARFIRPLLLSKFRDAALPPPISRVPKTEADRLRFDNDGADAAEPVNLQGVTVDLVSSDDDDDQPVNSGLAIVNLVSSDDDETKSDDEPVPWPEEVVRIEHAEFPPDIKVRDLGAVDWCGCQGRCDVETCHNAVTDIFCGSNNCRVGPRCGNHRRDFGGLQLRKGPVGYAVFTTKHIPYGHVIGEYAGEVTNFNYADSEEQREYTMALTTPSTAGEQLYIDAQDRGGITRFVNHSCSPNALFFETQNRRKLAVLLYAIEDIPAGTEVRASYGTNCGSTALLLYAIEDIPAGTEVRASYGDELWFDCKCGSPNCVSLSSGKKSGSAMTTNSRQR